MLELPAVCSITYGFCNGLFVHAPLAYDCAAFILPSTSSVLGCSLVQRWSQSTFALGLGSVLSVQPHLHHDFICYACDKMSFVFLSRLYSGVLTSFLMFLIECSK